MVLASCERDIKTDMYWPYAINWPIWIIIGLCLLFHSLYNMYRLKKHKIANHMRWLYLAQQIVGIMYSVFDLFKFVITPNHYNIVSNSFYCAISSCLGRYIACFNNGILLIIVLLRLDQSFKDSHLQISSRCVKFLFLLIVIPLILFVLIFTLFSNLSGDACIWSWYPSDINHTYSYYICATPENRWTYLTVIISISWVTIIELILGYLFTSKLYKVIKSVDTNDGKLKHLMIKNALLTVSTIISAIISVILWIALPNRQIYTALDQILNVIFIGLMFKYNERYYYLCCSVCIKTIEMPSKNTSDLSVYSTSQSQTELPSI